VGAIGEKHCAVAPHKRRGARFVEAYAGEGERNRDDRFRQGSS
jgi:hypothetical protein